MTAPAFVWPAFGAGRRRRRGWLGPAPPVRCRHVPFQPSRERQTSGDLTLVPLRGWRDRARFVDLPYRLHRGDPNWTPPLRRDVHRLLDRRRNPFFDHGEACFWLAWRNGIPVGRISAQINRLHLATHARRNRQFRNARGRSTTPRSSRL